MDHGSQLLNRSHPPRACPAGPASRAVGLKSNAEIVNLSGQPSELVRQLCTLLTEGSNETKAVAHADPKRDGFYDLETRERVFFIYVSPVSGKILLLATWPKEAAPCMDCAAD